MYTSSLSMRSKAVVFAISPKHCQLVQMRVLLNGSALCGVFIFTVANIMGMNLGDAPDRLSGTNPFEHGMLNSYPLFLTVRPLQPNSDF